MPAWHAINIISSQASGTSRPAALAWRDACAVSMTRRTPCAGAEGTRRPARAIGTQNAVPLARTLDGHSRRQHRCHPQWQAQLSPSVGLTPPCTGTCPPWGHGFVSVHQVFRLLDTPFGAPRAIAEQHRVRSAAQLLQAVQVQPDAPGSLGSSPLAPPWHCRSRTSKTSPHGQVSVASPFALWFDQPSRLRPRPTSNLQERSPVVPCQICSHPTVSQQCRSRFPASPMHAQSVPEYECGNTDRRVRPLWAAAVQLWRSHLCMGHTLSRPPPRCAGRGRQRVHPWHVTAGIGKPSAKHDPGAYISL